MIEKFRQLDVLSDLNSELPKSFDDDSDVCMYEKVNHLLWRGLVMQMKVWGGWGK